MGVTVPQVRDEHCLQVETMEYSPLGGMSRISRGVAVGTGWYWGGPEDGRWGLNLGGRQGLLGNA